MTNTALKTYLVEVIERAISYYQVEADDARSAAENWPDGEFHDRDDEALESEGPCNVRFKQPDGTWRKLPRSEWEDAPGNLPTRFDAYEIGPCLRLREDGERDRFYYEPCEPQEADVWTLYGHIPGQGVEAIGDFESCELAEQVYARITGKSYGR